MEQPLNAIQTASDEIGASVQGQASLNEIKAILDNQSMTVTETVILGIVSSIVATAILVILNWLVSNKLQPWYANKIYRGVRIDGEWSYHSIDGREIDIESSDGLHIEQSGDTIKGTYSHTDKEKSIVSYTLNGNIKDSYVTATVWPIARDQLDAGAMVLRIYSHDGLRMKGKVAFPDTVTGEVNSIDVVFQKK